MGVTKPAYYLFPDSGVSTARGSNAHQHLPRGRRSRPHTLQERHRVRCDTLLATGEAKALTLRRLHTHRVDGDAECIGDPLPHQLAVRRQLRQFQDDDAIDVGDDESPIGRKLGNAA